ncbi:MAG: hypothetical protein WAO52_20440 [Prolixibacteraceae bacterium]
MIYLFEVTSSEIPDFKRLIQLNSSDTFENLHRILQKTSNFDQSQMASFYLSDDHWKKKIEISSLDSGGFSAQHLSMQKIKLNDYVSAVGEKLIYVFDFFNERFFYLELKEKFMKTDLKEPFVAYEKGNAPAQLLVNKNENHDVDLLESDDTYKSFGELEDYYEIFGEMDA